MSNPTTPGWHPHPTAKGKYGYWNGREWDKEVRDDLPTPRAKSTSTKQPAPDNPLITAIFAIIGGGLVGGVLLGAGAEPDQEWLGTLGLLVLAASALAAQVGLVGYGVYLGLRYYHYKHPQP